MASEIVKQLEIKSNCEKRTTKEYEAYLKEETQQRDKIAKMKADGEDEAAVKKQMEVLNDTLTVLPDTRTRLQKYARELNDFIEEHYKDIGPAPATSGEEQSADTPEDPQAKARKLVLTARSLLVEATKWTGPIDGNEDGLDLGCGTGGTGDAPDDDV